MKLLIIALFITSTALCQSKDSLIKVQNKNDSLLITAVLNDISQTLYGKIDKPYYDLIEPIFKEYMRQKTIQWSGKLKK